MQARELHENVLEQELLGQGVRFYILQRDIVKLGWFAREHVVVADVAECDALLGEDVPPVEHVLGTFGLIWQQQFLCKLALVTHLVERVEPDCPVAFHDEVDLGHVGFFFVEVAVLVCVFEEARHEAERYLVQEVCVNMMFNLGRPRYSKFAKHLKAIQQHDWATAGAEARDSRWHTQVGDRAERLCQRLEALA